MEYTIAHIGSSDVENYGDLLFTDVLKKKLEKRIKIKEILYFAPKRCTMPNRKEQVHSVTELQELVEKRKIDAIIVGGGDLIYLHKIKTYMPHISEDYVDYEMLYMWVIPSIVAQKYNIPLIWNAPGVPKSFIGSEQKVVSWLCEAVDYISVRDTEAKKELSVSVKEEEITVVPDTVLSICDVLKREELDSKFKNMNLDLIQKEYIFFQCNVFMTKEDLNKAASALIQIKRETGYKILLQPIGYSAGDEGIIKELDEMYPGEFVFSPRHFDQYEILALVANSALYIGTSLHGCITANSYGVNNIVYNINRYNKIDGFVKLIDGNMIYKAEEILSTYHNLKPVSEEKIRKCIDRIEKHFDVIADLVCKEKSHTFQDAKELADYIYDNTVNGNIMAENENLKKKNQELQETVRVQQDALETITNSTTWKLTKPLRKTLDIIKKRS